MRPRGFLAGVLLLVVAAGAAACEPPPAEVRATPAEVVDVAAGTTLPERVPSGVVRVAVPDEPASFLDLRGDDATAADLGALWGLPLFRYDPSGQLAPGLVDTWEVVPGSPGWRIELVLRAGRWSDGTDVTADDVVATLEALRAGPRAVELGPLAAVTAVGVTTVRLTFDAPYARWWAVLDGVGVLPRAVLERGGLAAFDVGIPVAGGWFTLDEHVPGLRTTFVAHADGPLGAPGPERLEVLVVPRYEAALGMLRRGDADVVLGYLALNGVERAQRVEGVEAAAPLGGTTVGLWWRPDGRAGGTDAVERRRAIAGAIDVAQLVEGLLGPSGEEATSFWPGRTPAAAPPPPPPGTDVGTPTVLLPRWQEALAFTARALQRDLRTVGGGLELVAGPSPEVVRSARSTGDAVLAARRSGPAPTFAGRVADAALGLAADAGGPASIAFDDALSLARADALVIPLYRIGVVHAWSPAVAGLRPSSWPGLAFWDAGAWTVTAGEEP